jgi:hypothetical protein
MREPVLVQEARTQGCGGPAFLRGFAGETLDLRFLIELAGRPPLVYIVLVPLSHDFLFVHDTHDQSCCLRHVHECRLQRYYY